MGTFCCGGGGGGDIGGGRGRSSLLDGPSSLTLPLGFPEGGLPVRGQEGEQKEEKDQVPSYHAGKEPHGVAVVVVEGGI